MQRKLIRESITLDALKQWLYIDTPELDEKLLLCLYAAIAAAENYTGLTINPSEYHLTLPFSTQIALNVHPVMAISRIAVDGKDIESSHWRLDSDSVMFDGSMSGSVCELTLVAGYDVVEKDLEAAVMLIASDLFQNPTDTVRQMPTMSAQLLHPYKYYNI